MNFLLVSPRLFNNNTFPIPLVFSCDVFELVQLTRISLSSFNEDHARSNRSAPRAQLGRLLLVFGRKRDWRGLKLLGKPRASRIWVTLGNSRNTARPLHIPTLLILGN